MRKGCVGVTWLSRPSDLRSQSQSQSQILANCTMDSKKFEKFYTMEMRKVENTCLSRSKRRQNLALFTFSPRTMESRDCVCACFLTKLFPMLRYFILNFVSLIGSVFEKKIRLWRPHNSIGYNF